MDFYVANVSRTFGTLIVLKVSVLLYSLGRTGSVYVTILVTLERYFVVVHYFWTKSWLTPTRHSVITAVWSVLIVALNAPWWWNTKIDSLKQSGDSNYNGPLSGFSAVLRETKFGRDIYQSTWVGPVHGFLEFILPFLVLFVFNGLLYRYVSRDGFKVKTI